MSSASDFIGNIAFVFNDLFNVLKDNGVLDLAKGLKALAGLFK
ncbi:hypothetical protein CIP107539_02196 [Corynebacterium diphtheriae]|uniref:Uncharacterized protein n=1 Tax=Corynebacterium diphtheriae TaxID=1717 RepID=A0A811G5L9_CORDP|nr:hypothetical protein [Corynebacterium diphtheriae]CAB0525952.1 hypothetical protein CIP101841_02076 [Corynebacterium diphtheriae]CAB0616284.1 hypothetical protein CIP107559_02066 [Corynebacterium diphtheriae]CAB0618045.1 hypothetical protein CIP107558_01994 [Corynebacterium diphtheriae]CAB0619536.1 hypothetical protein CIP107539_02196 [Corynebacterium diphtheriae]CAB0619736.1 hypothetical protein CIP107547_02210 [Corynebacterium diphtheriae]